MKKGLLILLCLPMIGFGQLQYKLDSIEYLGGNTCFKYDQIGRCIQSTIGIDNIINNYVYDSNNNIIQIFNRNHNSSTDNFDTIAEIYLFYDNNNNLIQEDLFPIFGGLDTMRILYTYDISNNLTIKERGSIINGTYVNFYKTEFSYQNSELEGFSYFKWSQIYWDTLVERKFTYLNGDIFTDSAYINGIYGTTEYTYNIISLSNTAYPKFNIDSETFADLLPNNLYFLNKQPSEMIWNYPPNSSINSTIFHYSVLLPTTSIKDQPKNKELLKVTDLLGRETKETNQPLFYIYDDGTVEKRIVIE